MNAWKVVGACLAAIALLALGAQCIFDSILATSSYVSSPPLAIRAIDHRWPTALRFLLRLGVDPDSAAPPSRGGFAGSPGLPGAPALVKAAGGDEPEMVRDLLAAGAHVNAPDDYGRTALWFACEGRDLQLVQTLVEAGARVNPAAGSGDSPLEKAIQARQLEIVRYLISKGADLGDRSTRSLPLMVQAAHTGDLAIFDLLIERGKTTPTKGPLAAEILAAFVTSGSVEGVRSLLNRGISPNEQDHIGNTAMIIAAISSRKALPRQAIIRALLDAGGDPHLKRNVDNKCAIDFARANEDAETVSILERATRPR